jgi:hypothetical protein
MVYDRTIIAKKDPRVSLASRGAGGSLWKELAYAEALTVGIITQP